MCAVAGALSAPTGISVSALRQRPALVVSGTRVFPAYRCKACAGYYTLLSGTVFQKSHQKPSTLVLLLRGIAKGESSARLSRELGLGRKRVMQLRHAVQNNLYQTLPVQTMTGQDFEADELYQNAGEKRKAASGPTRPT